MKKQNILICGAGPVGMYFGAKFSKIGMNITYLEIEKRANEIKDMPLQIETIDKQNISFNPTVKTNIYDIVPPDIIFICVKTYQIVDVATKLVALLQPHTMVLSLQNGLEKEEILCKILGSLFVIGSVLEFNGELLEPRKMQQKHHVKVTFGSFNDHNPTQLKFLQEIFNMAEIHNQLVSDIKKEIWHNFIWSSIFLPISALTKSTLKQIYNSIELRNIAEKMLNEISQLCHKENIQIDYQNFYNPQRFEHNIKTSMLKDLEEHKHLEIDELLGIIVKKSQKYNLSLHTCETLYYLIKNIR